MPHRSKHFALSDDTSPITLDWRPYPGDLDAQTLRQTASLKPAEGMRLGGGAAPTFYLVRIS